MVEVTSSNLVVPTRMCPQRELDSGLKTRLEQRKAHHKYLNTKVGSTLSGWFCYCDQEGYANSCFARWKFARL